MGQRGADHGGFLVRQLLGEAGLGLLAGFLGLHFVNVVGLDGHVGHHGDALTGDLDEALANGKEVVLAILAGHKFTGRSGKQVPVADTVRGFKEILEGKHDDVGEVNFYMKGGIEEIKEA